MIALFYEFHRYLWNGAPFFGVSYIRESFASNNVYLYVQESAYIQIFRRHLNVKTHTVYLHFKKFIDTLLWI